MPEQVEKRVEYRIVGTERRTGYQWEGETRDQQPLERHLSQLRKRNDNVRIQRRAVETTPWEDVADV